MADRIDTIVEDGKEALQAIIDEAELATTTRRSARDVLIVKKDDLEVRLRAVHDQIKALTREIENIEGLEARRARNGLIRIEDALSGTPAEPRLGRP